MRNAEDFTKRDVEDFTEFVVRYAYRLKKVALLLTGNEHDAGNLLQTVLAKLYLILVTPTRKLGCDVWDSGARGQRLQGLLR